MAAITLTLPYPPSVNSIWRRVGNRTLLSARGRRYHDAVRVQLVLARHNREPIAGPVICWLLVNPPDRRKRDLDNIPKVIFDAMTKCRVWRDDSQVQFFAIARSGVIPGGCVGLAIYEAPVGTRFTIDGDVECECTRTAIRFSAGAGEQRTTPPLSPAGV